MAGRWGRLKRDHELVLTNQVNRRHIEGRIGFSSHKVFPLHLGLEIPVSTTKKSCDSFDGDFRK